MIRAILCDIEGTTTSVAFATRVLFPISFERMEQFIFSNQNESNTSKDIQSVKEEISKSTGKDAASIQLEEVISQLREWIRQDKKIGVLKAIQGRIWKESFESGQIRGHIYPDVPTKFHSWKERNISIHIFSSGSVEAQKLLFRYSVAGDLSGYIDRYFDTNVGPKKEAESYRRIANSLQRPTGEILFLSDVEAELDAAREAGFLTTLVARDHFPDKLSHPVVKSFVELQL